MSRCINNNNNNNTVIIIIIMSLLECIEPSNEPVHP